MLTIEARNGRGREVCLRTGEGRVVQCPDRRAAYRALLRALSEGVSCARAIGDRGTEMMAWLEADGSACVSVGVERVSAERLAQFREVAS